MSKAAAREQQQDGRIPDDAIVISSQSGTAYLSLSPQRRRHSAGAGQVCAFVALFFRGRSPKYPPLTATGDRTFLCACTLTRGPKLPKNRYQQSDGSFGAGSLNANRYSGVAPGTIGTPPCQTCPPSFEIILYFLLFSLLSSQRGSALHVPIGTPRVISGCLSVCLSVRERERARARERASEQTDLSFVARLPLSSPSLALTPYTHTL